MCGMDVEEELREVGNATHLPKRVLILNRMLFYTNDHFLELYLVVYKIMIYLHIYVELFNYSFSRIPTV